MQRNKMKFNIFPYVGVTSLKFGMTREEVRQQLKSQVNTFVRHKGSEPEDHFDDIGVFVYYNKKQKCCAIEMFPPAFPVFHELNLLDEHFTDLRKYFTNIDPDTKVDEDGLTTYKCGIGLYVPNLKDGEDQLAESIIVFEKGYYDNKTN
jgi:hypothetical protein